MYQAQIKEIQESLIKKNEFDPFLQIQWVKNGIQWLGFVMIPEHINQGRQNVYIDLFHEGKLYRGTNFWVNQLLGTPYSRRIYFDKAENEVGCNFPIWGDYNYVSLGGENSMSSSKITNISANRQVYGHTSWYGLATTSSIKTPTNPTIQIIETIEEQLEKLKKALS